MRTNIFDKNFTSLVQGKKKILSCPSEGVEIGVTNIPHTHHTTCHNPYQMAQHLPRITPPATLHVPQWKCGQGPWLVRMEPRMGMKPWMWGQNPGLCVQGSGSGMCPMMMDGNTSGVGESYVGWGTPVPLSPP